MAGNTALAHELLAHATSRGIAAAAWDRLFTAYFGEVRSVFDIDSLVEIAAEIGLDRSETRVALATRRYRDAVRADIEQAVALGATGVPLIVVDRTCSISGAQRPAAIVDALNTAWAAKHPTPGLARLGDAAADRCGPDGCSLPTHP